MKIFSKYFKEIGIKDVPSVGGKNASLGEMFQNLSDKGIAIPDGFALTSDAYWEFLSHNNLVEDLKNILSFLDTNGFSNLGEVGQKCRDLMLTGNISDAVKEKIIEGYNYLMQKYGNDISLAIRSSATAEDLPNASFAGQQETYLNVRGVENLLRACFRCYASLFTDRAIKYRVDNGFDHMKVALSIGIQIMVRSDKGCSGVIFTLDPDTGFEEVVLVSGAWGLGENVVQGTINTDEYLVYKPFIGKVKQPIISRKLGSKIKMMEYSEININKITKPEDAVINLDTPEILQQKFILEDDDVLLLAKWAIIIEQHYGRHMDIEWAKDGINNKLYIVQARPETVFNNKQNRHLYKEYHLKEESTILTSGIGLGDKITAGKARILKSPDEAYKLNKGEVLVTEKTDPDWDPILKKAAAIITNQGGRTSHAAIVAREVGAVAVVGTGDATKKIKDGQDVTVSCAGGETGKIYEGILKWEEKEIDTEHIKKPETKVMFILGDPEYAFRLSFLPNDGIGLMRLEFVISNAIQIHPMALCHFDKLTDEKAKEQIEKLTHHYPDKTDYFVHKLSEAVATIAAAFYPKDVIVRMSDFKSNEYANLIGGKEFEPIEANPMIGFRGASRYYHPKYADGFELECRAMKRVREEMGFNNVKIMIPFCRTVHEAEKVVALMEKFGLKRGNNGLELYMMVEIPSNVILAEKFAKYFDGFSIGSNDLTQLTLGADRDSGLLSEIFDANDEAVKFLICEVLKKAHVTGTKIGLCGQAPSDYPEYAQFLVENGITSISFNPDSLFKGIENILKAEEKHVFKNLEI
jgi:pyruvate,water dikinase